MNIVIKREEVLEGVLKIASILATSKTGPGFLRTIWIKAEEDQVQFLGTDSNVEIICTYPAQVNQTDLIGVSAKLFAELLKKLYPGEIKLKTKGQKLTITQGKNKYSLPVVEKSWFQELSTFPEESKVIWLGEVFKEAIEKVYFCISDDENLNGMACLNVENSNQEGVIEFCGLNGPKMAIYTITNDDIYNNLLSENKILINKKLVNEIKKVLPNDEIELTIKNNKLFIRSIDQKESYSFPLSSYDFPNYHKFLDEYKDKIVSILEIDKELLIQAMDRLVLFNENNKSVIFNLSKDTVSLSAYGSDVGSAEEILNCNYQGDMERIVLLAKDVIEILDHFNSSVVKFNFSGPTTPFKVTSDNDPNYFVYAMPIEIEEEIVYSEEEE